MKNRIALEISTFVTERECRSKEGLEDLIRDTHFFFQATKTCPIGKAYAKEFKEAQGFLFNSSQSMARGNAAGHFHVSTWERKF